MRLCGIFIPSLGRRMSSPSTRRVANFTLFTPLVLITVVLTMLGRHGGQPELSCTKPPRLTHAMPTCRSSPMSGVHGKSGRIAQRGSFLDLIVVPHCFSMHGICQVKHEFNYCEYPRRSYR